MFHADAVFRVTLDIGALTLTPHGDIDMATAEQFRRAADELIVHQDERDLVIDLSDVSFIDSSGLGVLLRMWHATRRMVIRTPSPQTCRLLEVSGTDAYLPVKYAVPCEASTAPKL